jgi:8-oxo-dGTP diphosphatase
MLSRYKYREAGGARVLGVCSIEAKGVFMSVQYPIPATIPVVFQSSDVLLVRRANPPDAGRWGFPGGKIERGETIMRAAERELFEETSIVGKARHVLTAVDAFERSSAGAVLHHFVLIAVICKFVRGVPSAADDVTEAKWFAMHELGAGDLALSLDVEDVAKSAFKYVNENSE